MSETEAAPRVLIMGVGNILLRDEGFGVAAVNHLEKNYDWPENVRLQEGATQGLLLMSELEECDLLVVLDVVLGGKEPGTVYLLENEQQKQVKKFIREQTRQMRSAPVSPELDVRGMTVDEAIGVLDIFLDNAMMANLPSVRIIHGKGTGALRRGITEHLKRRKGIKDFRLGVYGEGEDGVTIISLAN